MEKKEANHGALIRGFATKAIHVAQEPDPSTGAVVAPVVLTSTYVIKPGASYVYSRLGNPNRNTVEQVVAVLEHAKYALCCSSGNSGGSLITHLLHPGDEIVACQDMYGGLVAYFDGVAIPHLGLGVKYVDFGNKAEFLGAFTEKTKMVWMESPSNPLLNIYDIAEVARLCHEKKVLLVFDNTFYSPYLLNPLDLGADIVLHSATKYIGGHSDILMGFICLSNEEIYKRLKVMHGLYGGCPSGFDSYLALRGIKTLQLRMERAQSNALQLAEFLSKDPHVECVYYPGLPTHMGYEINKRQARGTGAMLSFKLKGADLAQTGKFCQSLHLYPLAGSLGGVEGLICIPAIFTHSKATPEFKKKVGVTDNLIRVSVGIEDFQDIHKDFADALKILP